MMRPVPGVAALPVLALPALALPALAQNPPQRPFGLADRLAEGMLTQARRANLPEDQMPEWRRLAACAAQALIRSDLANAAPEQAARNAAASRTKAEVERRTDLRDEAQRLCMGGQGGGWAAGPAAQTFSIGPPASTQALKPPRLRRFR